MEKSRRYFRYDSPVIPVFFQLECRATPDAIKVHFSTLTPLFRSMDKYSSSKKKNAPQIFIRHLLTDFNEIWPYDTPPTPSSHCHLLDAAYQLHPGRLAYACYLQARWLKITCQA